MRTLMINLREKLLEGEIGIDNLKSYKDDIGAHYEFVMKHPDISSEYDVYALIMLCLDYYICWFL